MSDKKLTIEEFMPRLRKSAENFCNGFEQEYLELRNQEPDDCVSFTMEEWIGLACQSLECGGLEKHDE